MTCVPDNDSSLFFIIKLIHQSIFGVENIKLQISYSTIKDFTNLVN